ncbi:hypothetical protein STENM223S_00005 [Streptomyces tendae]
MSLRGLSRLVRQRLPRRVLHDPLGREEGAQGGRQVLRLAVRRRHGEHGAAGVTGQGGDGEGAGRGRADEVDVHAVAVGGGGDRFREGGVLDDGVEQTVQAHAGRNPSGGVQHVGPTRLTGRGCQPTTPAPRPLRRSAAPEDRSGTASRALLPQAVVRVRANVTVTPRPADRHQQGRFERSGDAFQQGKVGMHFPRSSREDPAWVMPDNWASRACVIPVLPRRSRTALPRSLHAFDRQSGITPFSPGPSLQGPPLKVPHSDSWIAHHASTIRETLRTRTLADDFPRFG